MNTKTAANQAPTSTHESKEPEHNTKSNRKPRATTNRNVKHCSDYRLVQVRNHVFQTQLRGFRTQSSGMVVDRSLVKGVKRVAGDQWVMSKGHRGWATMGWGRVQRTGVGGGWWWSIKGFSEWLVSSSRLNKGGRLDFCDFGDDDSGADFGGGFQLWGFLWWWPQWWF